MDATTTSVIRLHEQGLSKRKISERTHIGYQKVLQILITAGLEETEESKLYANGKSVDEICKILKKSKGAVVCRIPYQKGMYNAEYPTANAIRIRRSRGRYK